MKDKQDMTQGVIYKQVLLFFLPIVAGSFFQHFYSIVDAIVVGRGLGYLEFAAVSGSASKMIVLITNFFLGVSAGITVYASRYYGKKDFVTLKSVIANGLVLFTIIGIVVSAICIIFSDSYLKMMSTPEDTMEHAKNYLNTYLFGMVFCVIYNTLAGVLRALGDAKRPLFVLAICSVLNIVLDILFALVLDFGVIGVALATVISQVVSAIILSKMLWDTLKGTDSYEFKLDKTIIKEISAMGIPSGIQSMMFSFSNMAVQSAVNGFNSITVAGWGAYLKIDSIADVFLSSLANAVTPFVGQNLGAGKIDRMKESMKEIMRISYIMMSIVTVLFLLLRVPLLSLFTDEPEVVEIGAAVMFYILPMYLLGVPQRMYSTAIRAFGKSFGPMWLSLIGVVGLRFLWVYLILPLHPTIFMLGLCYPISSLIMSVIFTIYYKKELAIVEQNN